MRSKVSVVIATLNRHATLLKTLPRLLEQKEDFSEIVIVDQSDEIPRSFLDFIKKEPKIKFHRFSIKKLTAARNEGIRLAKGDIIVFLDDDSLVFPGLIKAHIANYKDPKVGAVTGREVLQDNPEYRTKGKGQTVTEKGEIIPSTASCTKGEVDSLWGANMSIRRDVLNKIGGFDEDILLIRDETDVSLRIRLLGYKIIFEPKAQIIHLQEKKGGTRFDKRLMWYFKFFHDEIYFQLKYFSWRYLLHFFIRKLRPILACMFYYGKGHPRALIVPFAAFWTGIKTYKKNKGTVYVPLRVGVDAHHLASKTTGKEAYALGLLKELAALRHTNLYFLYARRKAKIDASRFIWRCSRLPSFLWYLWAWWQIKLDGIDVLFAPTSYVLASLMPKKALPVIHDLAVFRKDFKSLLRARIVEKLLLKRVIKAKRLIAVSRFTANDLVKRFDVSRDKIVVISPALLDLHPVPEKTRKAILRKYKIQKPYILFVGTVEPRKNLQVLIRAFRSLPVSVKRGFQLLIVGKKGWYADEILASAKGEKNIRFLGYVPRKVLSALFEEAELFVLPSKWEGFGIPILEAFYFRVPVIVSKVSSLPEVGGEAVFYINPQKVDSLRTALLRVIQDEKIKERLRKEGAKRLKLFSYRKSAKRLLKVLTDYA